MNPTHVMNILILCTGNSCRSQMAQGFLQSFDNRLEVYSAGTQPLGRVDSKAIDVMKEAGVDISRHTSDAVEKYLDISWDFVITVCDQAHEACPYFTGEVRNRLHIGIDDPSKETGTPEFIQNEYRRVREVIRRSFLKFYDEQLKPQL